MQHGTSQPSRTMSRRQLLKWATSLTASTCVATLLGACASAPTAPAATQAAAQPTSAPAAPQGAAATAKPSAAGATRTLTIGLSDDIYGLNDSWLPHRLPSVMVTPRASAYDVALGTDPANPFKVAPGLCESWTEQDTKEFTFKVRKGVKWHNGDGEVTADDVLYSLKLVTQSDSKAIDGPYWRARVNNMEVVDANTLKMSFPSTEPELLLMLTMHGNQPILSKKYVESVGIDKADVEPVGSGPYKMAKLVPASELNMVPAGSTHWRGAAQWAGINALKMPSDATRMALLDSGRADMVNIIVEQVEECKSKGYTVIPAQTGSAYAFNFGGMFQKGHKLYTGQEPWHDVRVREAMNLAIDRDAINKTFFAGMGVIDNIPGAAIAPPATTSAKTKIPYDPERAKALVKEAGAEGKAFDFVSYPLTSIPNQNVVQVVAAAWEAIGLKPNIKPMDYQAFRDMWVKNQTAGLVFPWGMSMRPLFLSRYEKFFNGKSEGFTIYYDDETTKLYDQIKSTGDPDARDKLLADAMNHLVSQWASVPILSCPYALFAANPTTVGSWPGWWQTYSGYDSIVPA